MSAPLDLHAERGWQFLRRLAWTQVALGVVGTLVLVGIIVPFEVPPALWPAVLVPLYLLGARVIDALWHSLDGALWQLDFTLIRHRPLTRRGLYAGAVLFSIAHAVSLWHSPPWMLWSCLALVVVGGGSLTLLAARVALEVDRKSRGAALASARVRAQLSSYLKTRPHLDAAEKERLCRFVSINAARLPTNPGLRVRGCYYPDLPSLPVHVEVPDWLRDLRRHLQAIAQEARQTYQEGRYRAYAYPGVAEPGWSSFQLYSARHGGWTSSARELCPATVSALEASSVLFPQEIMFSALEPHSRIPPHRDDSNITLSAHFGLDVPPGCAMKVAGRTVVWPAGDVLLFDASYEHEVWNHSDDVRLVLLIDVFHPALSPHEVEFLQSLDWW